MVHIGLWIFAIATSALALLVIVRLISLAVSAFADGEYANAVFAALACMMLTGAYMVLAGIVFPVLRAGFPQ